MTNLRRDVKEATATREAVFAELGNLDLSGMNLELVGRGKEGLVYRNTEDGLFVEIKAVAKQPNFDGDESVAEYEQAQAKEAERVAKRKDKEEAAQLKRAEAKAKKEAAELEEMAETEDEDEEDEEDEESPEVQPEESVDTAPESEFVALDESFHPVANLSMAGTENDVQGSVQPAGRTKDEINGTTPVEY